MILVVHQISIRRGFSVPKCMLSDGFSGLNQPALISFIDKRVELLTDG